MFSGQFEGGGEAGVARADNGDVAVVIAGQGRHFDCEGIGGGLPITVNRVVKVKGMRMGGG